MDDLSVQFERALLAGDRLQARAVVDRVADAPFGAMLEQVVVPALQRIGDAWEHGDAALSQVYMAGRITEDLLSSVRPAVSAASAAAPRVAITVLEDHHLLGKRMVLSVLNAMGVPVEDWGTTSVEQCAAKVKERKIQLLLVSVLMLPSALRVKVLVERLAELGCAIPVIVGGAPFRLDPTLAARVGATASGASAADAVRLVRQFQGGAHV